MVFGETHHFRKPPTKRQLCLQVTMRLPPSPPEWSLQSKDPCRVCGPVGSEVHWSSPRPSLVSWRLGELETWETCGNFKHWNIMLKFGFPKKIWKLWTTKHGRLLWSQYGEFERHHSHLQSDYVSTHPFSILCVLLFLLLFLNRKMLWN